MSIYELTLPGDQISLVVAFTTPRGERFARPITEDERKGIEDLVARGSSLFDAYAAVCTREMDS